MKNKRIITVFIIAMLCGIGAILVHPGQTLAADQTGTVTASVLNVRTGAGTSYSILQYNGSDVKLSQGTEVTITETLTGWYKVSFTYSSTTLKGYVSADYVTVSATATATPTATASSSSTTTTTTTTTTYRTETTYKAIKVPAKVLSSAPLYKKNGKTRYKVSGKKIILAKGKSIKLVGEKLIDKNKWFKVSFRYKKKTRKAYIQSTYVKMTLKTSATAKIYNTSKAVKIRKRKGNKSPYKKVSGKTVKLAKNTTVSILKDTKVKKTRWYKISYTYNNKTKTGYINAKYVKLVKKAVTKKVAVTVLSDAEFEASLESEGFPESYKDSLRALHQEYPYWQFKAYDTGLDWDTALAAESVTGVNLISNSKSKAWKSTASDAYDSSTGTWKVFDGSTWVAASEAAIAYYMDPRNFLNDRCIYMFEQLEYQSQYQTKAGVNTILKNTPFYKTKFTYTDTTTGETKKMYYAKAFMKAAKSSKVSPYHLASRVKQEVVTSSTTTSSAVSGTVSGYEGIYNFYNIGATSSSNPVLNGLKWAANTSAGTYLRPWTDPYRSIVGGAEYIASSYISKGQNTGYLQKFNVTSYKRYSHQYMTNVEAAYSEAIKTKNAYSGTLDESPLVFSIPVYNNMPSENCAMPG